MNKQNKKIAGLFARYLTIILIGLGNLYILYKILTPLTIHVLNTILSVFSTSTAVGNIIHTATVAFEIIPACVAGSAFYLLLLLLMSTANIKPETRAKAIITAIAMLFALNILRLIFLISMTNSPQFETLHWIFWHLISTIFVVAVWFTTIKIYKIKSIPIYSDLKYIASLMKPKKSKRKKKHKQSTAAAF